MRPSAHRERGRLSAFAGAVVLIHVLGWGLFWWYSRRYPALAGLGTLAYTFGLRHAFDADHIAAIDNTTRKLLQDGKRPVGVGFFFSLGHSTVVFALVAALAVAAQSVGAIVDSLHSYGGYIGPSTRATAPQSLGSSLTPARTPAHVPRAARSTATVADGSISPVTT